MQWCIGHWVVTTQFVGNPPVVTAVTSATDATGISNPKGGKKALIQTRRTLNQMLKLAKDIEDSCDELITITKP
jgi:hypothetical protein